jgi:hypothetical protein
MFRLMLCVYASAGSLALGLAALLAPSALAGDWAAFVICVSTATISLMTVTWHFSGPERRNQGCGQSATLVG